MPQSRARNARRRLGGGDHQREACELAQPERALDIGEAEVVADAGHLVGPRTLLLALAEVAGDAVPAENAHLRGEFRVIGRDRATFAGGDRLHRMKAEGAQIGERPTGRPPSSAPSAWQASATIFKPCRSAIARSAA